MRVFKWVKARNLFGWELVRVVGTDNNQPLQPLGGTMRSRYCIFLTLILCVNACVTGSDEKAEETASEDSSVPTATTQDSSGVSEEKSSSPSSEDTDKPSNGLSHPT